MAGLSQTLPTTVLIIPACWHWAPTQPAPLPPSWLSLCAPESCWNISSQSPFQLLAAPTYFPLSFCVTSFFPSKEPLISINFEMREAITMIPSFLGCLACLSFNHHLNIMKCSYWSDCPDQKTGAENWPLTKATWSVSDRSEIWLQAVWFHSLCLTFSHILCFILILYYIIFEGGHFRSCLLLPVFIGHLQDVRLFWLTMIAFNCIYSFFCLIRIFKFLVHLLCPNPALVFLFGNNHNRQDFCPEAHRIMEGVE